MEQKLLGLLFERRLHDSQFSEHHGQHLAEHRGHLLQRRVEQVVLKLVDV
jgi:hypothetical protein